MTPGAGQLLVTIRIERDDGQFTLACRLVPDDLLARPEPDLARDEITCDIAAMFTRVYRQAAELPR